MATLAETGKFPQFTLPAVLGGKCAIAQSQQGRFGAGFALKIN
jgi:hypothetical protein